MLSRMSQEEWQKANYGLIDSDLDGAGQPRRLLKILDHLALHGIESPRFVEVTCPSTGKVYWNRVPPQVQTCCDAVAWRFGAFDIDMDTGQRTRNFDYAPVIEQ